MDFNALYKQFNDEFWDYFLSSEKARNRKGVTWGWWSRERGPVARKAMYAYLKEYGAPDENPYYWVKRFPEPVPKNYNGENNIPTDRELFIALYKGQAGIYTRQDVEDFEMTIKKRFTL